MELCPLNFSKSEKRGLYRAHPVLLKILFYLYSCIKNGYPVIFIYILVMETIQCHAFQSYKEHNRGSTVTEKAEESRKQWFHSHWAAAPWRIESISNTHYTESRQTLAIVLDYFYWAISSSSQWEEIQYNLNKNTTSFLLSVRVYGLWSGRVQQVCLLARASRYHSHPEARQMPLTFRRPH